MQTPHEPTPSLPTERTPKRVEPYVEAFGEDGAVDFLLKFGGQLINIPASAEKKSKLIKAIGAPKVSLMLDVFGQGQLKVPVAKRWIAQRLDARGVARSEIGKLLRVTRESVRMYFQPQKYNRDRGGAPKC